MILSLLAQLSPQVVSADGLVLPESSSTLTVIMAIILIAGILLVAFRPAKRDRLQQ